MFPSAWFWGPLASLPLFSPLVPTLWLPHSWGLFPEILGHNTRAEVFLYRGSFPTVTAKTKAELSKLPKPLEATGLPAGALHLHSRLTALPHLIWIAPFPGTVSVQTDWKQRSKSLSCPLVRGSSFCCPTNRVLHVTESSTFTCLPLP